MSTNFQHISTPAFERNVFAGVLLSISFPFPDSHGIAQEGNPAPAEDTAATCDATGTEGSCVAASDDVEDVDDVETRLEVMDLELEGLSQKNYGIPCHEWETGD